MVFSGAVVVITHHHIEGPMEAIFDLPMASNEGGRDFCRWAFGKQV